MGDPERALTIPVRPSSIGIEPTRMVRITERSEEEDREDLEPKSPEKHDDEDFDNSATDHFDDREVHNQLVGLGHGDADSELFPPHSIHDHVPNELLIVDAENEGGPDDPASPTAQEVWVPDDPASPTPSPTGAFDASRPFASVQPEPRP